ncbi:MAG: MFS transporter [Candidatus Omnitrophota bacterium]|nr:MFS transporter [Candidatus Omnitrophota bacterium]
MAKLREVLKNKNFFFLWLGQIISQFGDRLNQMALIALVYQRTPGSALELAKLISFTIIPVFIIGPVAGVYVDRWDRRRTMYICDFLRAGIIFLIPFLFFFKQSMFPIYILIFLAFSLGRFFVPAKMSIVPDLVKEKDLLLANSLINTTGMIAAALGFGLSGILISWIGPRGGFYLDSLSFFVSASFIFFISSKINSYKKEGFLDLGREVLEVIKKSVASEIKEGIFYLTKNKDLRYIVLILFMLWAALGSIYTVVIIFVQGALNSVTKDLGLLVMFLGVGLFLGAILYGKFGQKSSLFKIIFLSLALSGLVLIVFTTALIYAPSFFMAAALISILGISVSPIMIACNTLTHQASDSEMRGKVFSSLEVVIHLAFLISMFLSAFIADKIGHTRVLVGVGLILVLSGVLGVIFNDRNRRAQRIN